MEDTGRKPSNHKAIHGVSEGGTQSLEGHALQQIRPPGRSENQEADTGAGLPGGFMRLTVEETAVLEGGRYLRVKGRGLKYVCSQAEDGSIIS